MEFYKLSLRFVGKNKCLGIVSILEEELGGEFVRWVLRCINR